MKNTIRKEGEKRINLISKIATTLGTVTHTHTHTHTIVLSNINKKLVNSKKNIFSNNFVKGTNKKCGTCFKCATFYGALKIVTIKNINVIKLQNLKKQGLKYLSRAPTIPLNFFDTG